MIVVFSNARQVCLNVCQKLTNWLQLSGACIRFVWYLPEVNYLFNSLSFLNAFRSEMIVFVMKQNKIKCYRQIYHTNI